MVAHPAGLPGKVRQDKENNHLCAKEDKAVKKYEYVSLHIGKLSGAELSEHRQIIDEYASKGYSYIGYIPTNISDYGKLKDIDLIFEIDVAESK